MTSESRPTLVFVGGGPRTTSLLERMAASWSELAADRPVDVHVIDPYPPGGGRIWRRDQSRLLWMNSVAADVAMYTDSSVVCDGPHVPGPTLAEWVAGVGRSVLTSNGLGAEAASFDAQDFASREIQSHYLAWVFDRAIADLPPSVTVHVHRDRAVQVVDIADGNPRGRARQRVRLAGGRTIVADVVILAQGYLDREPTPAEDEIRSAAAASGLNFIGPSYTADLDLDPVPAGGPVIIRGFGLAFVDLMIRLGEERGGRFDRDPQGALHYTPSGAEPVLWVGSRRGVPYHAKLSYVDLGAPPVALRYFTVAALEQIHAVTGRIDYREHLWPLLVKELTYAHYRELFDRHAARTTGDWPTFAAGLDVADVRSTAFLDFAAGFVPDARDRFDIRTIDRPLAGESFAGEADLTARLRTYIADDLARRADSGYSSDLAVFNTLLAAYGAIGQTIVAGRISPYDRIQRIEGDLHGFFSFLASGPPPQRLEELLALNAAGVVRFLGPDLKVDIDGDAFVARSPAVGGAVRAGWFIEGRLPKPDVVTATDPVIRSLLAAGQLAIETGSTPSPPENPDQSEGFALSGGHLLADQQSRAIRADGSVHPLRFLLGPSVAGSLGSAGFSRPHYNSPFLRQNDAVARRVLGLLAARAVTIPEQATVHQLAPNGVSAAVRTATSTTPPSSSARIENSYAS